jgi:hypothetical protein
LLGWELPEKSYTAMVCGGFLVLTQNDGLAALCEFFRSLFSPEDS